MEADYPFIFEVMNLIGARLTTVVAHTQAEAEAMAHNLYSHGRFNVVNTGKRKPPGKCCDKCKDHPCG